MPFNRKTSRNTLLHTNVVYLQSYNEDLCAGVAGAIADAIFLKLCIISSPVANQKPC